MMKLELFINHKKTSVDIECDGKEIDLSGMNITSLEGLLPSLEGLTTLVISDNQITSLQGLPSTLTELVIWGNQITSLEGIPSTLTTLDISNNRITSLQGLPSTLTTLDISRNRITSLQGLPSTLTELVIYCNLITSLPISLVHLRNLRSFHYSGNPIELGEIHPSVQRFLNNIENRTHRQGNTIYDDGQNVHNITVQNSIRESLNKLTTYPQKLVTSKLAKEEYDFLNSKEVHSFFNFTQTEVLLFVENAIFLCKEEVKSEVYSLLKEALREGKCVCSTGRIGRLVNVLSGFDDNVQIKISNNEQIGAIISTFRERGEPKEKVEEELLSRGIEKEEISEWLEYY
jgi:hypothetical protein